ALLHTVADQQVGCRQTGFARLASPRISSERKDRDPMLAGVQRPTAAPRSGSYGKFKNLIFINIYNIINVGLVQIS
ncbi:MAG: hypothetical protein VW453_01355, partial [Rhodospirillaceae bacterium]